MGTLRDAAACVIAPWDAIKRWDFETKYSISKKLVSLKKITKFESKVLSSVAFKEMVRSI